MLMSESGPTLDGLEKHFGELMEDERSEPKEKPLWTGLGVLSGMFIAQCIHQHILHWHAFSGQEFKAFRWDDFLVSAFGAFVLTWVVPVGQRKEITTLGIGEATTKKLR